MPKYFDVHCHLNAEHFKTDVDQVINRMIKAETNAIVIGTNIQDSQDAVSLAEKYDGLYAYIGVHPVDDLSASFDKNIFETLVKHPKVVGIGECGMDFFHQQKDVDLVRQRNLFEAQIKFALDHNKPIMIHARDAYEEILEILEPLKELHEERLKGNVHFFAGNWDIAQRFLALGFTLSFTGAITFTRNYDEVIKRAPLQAILAETDSPFVAPVPHRGKRNEPSYVGEVVKQIAEIRGEEFEEVRRVLVNNALNMVG